MMTEQNIQALMQHLPEEYLEEAAAFRMAHPMPAAQAPSLKAETPPRFLLRAALPIAAAACLVAVCGLFWWMGTRDDMRTVESRMHEIDEQRTSAAQTDSADSSETTASETSETTATTAAETETAPAQGSVRVTGSAAGTAAQGTAKAQGTGAAQSTTKQTAKTTKPASNQTSAAETEPKLPYDPDIVAQYRLGDVDMNGQIDVCDAQLLLQEYGAVVVEGGNSILTPEQRYLGDVTDERIVSREDVDLSSGIYNGAPAMETDYIISTADSDWILVYYAEYHLMYYDLDFKEAGLEPLPITDFIEFYRIYGHVPYVDENGDYVQNLLSGYIDSDTADDYLNLPDLAPIPIRLSGRKNWVLTEYYYSRWGKGGYVEYTAQDDDDRFTLWFYEIAESNYYNNKSNQEQKEPGLRMPLPVDGDPVWYQRAYYLEQGERVYYDSWTYGCLEWFNGEFSAHVDYYDSESIDDWIDVVELCRYLIQS